MTDFDDIAKPAFVYNFEARRSPNRLLLELGLSREDVAALVAGRPLPRKARSAPRIKPRPQCLVCRKPINSLNCSPQHKLVV